MKRRPYRQVEVLYRCKCPECDVLREQRTDSPDVARELRLQAQILGAGAAEFATRAAPRGQPWL